MFRPIRWPFAGRLRTPAFHFPSIGKPAASALASRFPHSASSRFGQFPLQALPGKPHPAIRGIIGLRYVVRSGGIGLRWGSWPLPPNKSFKPTPLRGAA